MAAADPESWERTLERALQRDPGGRWLGWRRRLLVAIAVAACVALFVFVRALSALPVVPGGWRAGPQGSVVLVDAKDSTLREARGRTLVGIAGVGAPAPLRVDALLLHPTGRWQVDDAQRVERLARLRQLDSLLQGTAGPLALQFADGSTVPVQPQPRGLAGLGALFWLWAALALTLALVGAVLALARPGARNALFWLACLAQAGNLAFAAAQAASGLGSAWAPGLEAPLRACFDLATAAATLHVVALAAVRAGQAAPAGGGAAALGPLSAGFARIGPWAAWSGVLAFATAALGGRQGGLWWVTQGLFALLMALAWVLARRAHRALPDPFFVAVRRLMAVVLVVWGLVTLMQAVAPRLLDDSAGAAALAAMLWTLFGASLLLLTPFLSRSRQLLREFALLAGVSTVATSLDLLFAAIFSLGPFASLALAVFLALGLYALVRQWLLEQMIAGQVLTTERTFERIHEVAREVLLQPGSYAARAVQLLNELFDPVQALLLASTPAAARVLGNGALLVVPVLPPEGQAPAQAVVLRFAARGRRLFSRDDARLAERVLDQLRRAVAFDTAVQRGRAEERTRLAQDLHDDIGARLLTLMYQAQTPEMEDYIRQTIKDLKTLSRGLAAGEVRLSHAAAEWKADLTRRCEAARVRLDWQLECDHDPLLSVVAWSALTRVLRELTTNVLAHAGATVLRVQLVLAGKRLRLAVVDDGEGRDPQGWSHGLGLAGVRKRVKQLGGEVRWVQREPRGIACELSVPEVTDRG